MEIEQEFFKLLAESNKIRKIKKSLIEKDPQAFQILLFRKGSIYKFSKRI